MMETSIPAVAAASGEPLAEPLAQAAPPGLELLLPMREVIRITSLSKATIVRQVNLVRFPKPVELSPGRVA